MMKYLWTLMFIAILFAACGEDDTPCPDCKTHNWKLDETPYEYKVNIPAHMGNIQALIPADNPLTNAKVALGKKLFYDPLLSRDYTVSCSSCHHPDKAFSDPRTISLGVEDRPGTRNAPALMNLMFGKSFFWDGNTATLEEQALIPIAADFEMDNTVEEVIRRINSDTVYQRMFWEAFGKDPDADGLARAIASFERILVSFNSRFDEYIIAEPPIC
ncbi:MAG: cytochrome-c peroxidase [Bacteroidia bacterium]